MTAGEKLRALRERLGLSIRMVESASEKLAIKYNNPDYFISLSRLSDIETKGIIPSIYRVYSLSVIYRADYHEVLKMYDLDLGRIPTDLTMFDTPNSGLAPALEHQAQAEMPLIMDPGFRGESTTLIVRMIQQWGTVPMTLLKNFLDRKYTYGYIGAKDWTMYPLLSPGAFVQIDENRTKVADGGWRSEYERPIYFVEMRDGFTCCWCDQEGSILTLRSHPMSPVKNRTVRLGSEAEILGQVVGIAMRLDQFSGN
ncbi:MAG: helix-turn-helix transcriptional regulator [Terriglobia bacterium]|nr:helix-turn-helix transcriptional regulator [Terriglobia bacterium]